MCIAKKIAKPTLISSLRRNPSAAQFIRVGKSCAGEMQINALKPAVNGLYLHRNPEIFIDSPNMFARNEKLIIY